jgi:death-on-curing protein
MYALGIIRNHPFIDGNKRTGFAAMFIFLSFNGMTFDPPEVDATITILRLAASDLSDDEFIDWVRMHALPKS